MDTEEDPDPVVDIDWALRWRVTVPLVVTVGESGLRDTPDDAIELVVGEISRNNRPNPECGIADVDYDRDNIRAERL